ncbi:cache domain-containing protein, partial [Helicobacter sp. MIT 05-5294]|uniref:cache domain-containing protein n=1 Tax=Helicobacter sp. MIT 05-5294 TaxID=1548150 RepID=UPI001107A57D
MFKHLSIKFKILVLVIGIIVGLVSIFGVIEYFEGDIIQNTRAELHEVVGNEVEQKIKLATDTLAESLGELIVGLDEPSQIAIIATAIEKFRFEDDKSGYYFAYKEYTPVAHPTRKDLIGKSLYEAKDTDGVYYVRDLFETAKTQKKQTKFVHFSFSKPLPDGTLGTAQKVGYAVMIPNTQNIWISTGVYVDTLDEYTGKISVDLIKFVDDTLFKAFLVGILVLFVILAPLIWLFYGNLIFSVQAIQTNLSRFFSYLNHDTTTANLIKIESHDEFGIMAKEINQNIQNIQKGLEKDEIAIAQ